MGQQVTQLRISTEPVSGGQFKSLPGGEQDGFGGR